MKSNYLDLKEAAYQRIDAERKVWQQKGDLSKVTSETLLDAAGTYIDLLTARSSEAVSVESEKKLIELAGLAQTLAKTGFLFLPDPGGPAVQACHSDDLRDAFLGQRKKRRNAAADSSAPRMAYQRALNSAVERGLMAMRNNAGQCVIWKKG